MAQEVVVAPQEVVRAEAPEEWREQVRELRAENARCRKENQELRAALAAAESRGAEAEAARSAEVELARRELACLAAARRRLKLMELGRATRAALEDAAARLQRGSAEGGGAARVVDMAKALRLLERVPSPVDLERDLMVDGEGAVTLESDAARRLEAYCGEIAELVSAPAAAAVGGLAGPAPTATPPPPVGGEPPRAAARPGERLANCWEPGRQPRGCGGRARAALCDTARAHARELEELAAP